MSDHSPNQCQQNQKAHTRVAQHCFHALSRYKNQLERPYINTLQGPRLAN